jgi:hypothetical protein
VRESSYCLPRKLTYSAYMKLALRTVALLVFALPAAAGAQPPGDVPPAIETHDNRRPAGTLRGGELRITLWESMGRW